MNRLLLILLLCLSVDASANQWVQRSSLQGLGRHRASGIGFNNQAFVGLGHYNGTGVETYFSDWWCYEPSSNSWTQKAAYPGNNGNGNLGCHSWIYNNYIFVGLGEILHRQFYRYDPAANSWEQMPNAPAGVNFQDQQEMQVGDKAYFTDIYNDVLYEYNCSTDSWTLKGPLPIPWNYSFAGFTYDDKCWVKADMSMYTYDPVQNLWYQVSAGTFPGSAKRAHASFFVNDKFYVVCGYGVTYSDVNHEVWEFDPALYQWTQMADFQGTSRRYTLGFAIGNMGYMCTGTNGTNLNDLWEFNKYLGEDEQALDFAFSVFPNPAVEMVNINSGQMKDFVVKLYDLSGNKVQQQETVNGTAMLFRNNLTSGTYLYKIYSHSLEITSGTLVFQ